MVEQADADWVDEIRSACAKYNDSRKNHSKIDHVKAGDYIMHANK